MSEYRPNLVANFEDELNQYLDLVEAHSKLHPDRDQCGGIGACLMMRTEVDQENELTETYLRQLADSGVRLTVGVRKEQGR